MDVSRIALSGLQGATKDLQVAATNIANQTTPGFKADKTEKTALDTGGVQVDVKKTDQDVDTAEQLVNADVATYSFKANLKVLETQKKNDKALLDIQA